MRNMRFVDLHCDSVFEMYLQKKGLDELGGHINLDKLRRGGAMVQCFAAFIATHECAERNGVTLGAYELFNAMADIFDREMSRFGEYIAPVRSVADIEKNIREGKISAMLTMEDAAPLDGRIERVDELYARGVRMAALTWNYENSLAYPNSALAAEHSRGLKPFGIEAVTRMEELGMICDVSHLSEGGFWDVARYTKKPFIASHSCARALCHHQRNLTDEQLRAVAEHGGVVGVNFYSAFLNGREDITPTSDIIAHMDYIRNKAGVESVALGSDFDGIDCKLEIGDCTGLTALAESMERCFTDDEIDLICSKNALRVFHDVIG